MCQLSGKLETGTQAYLLSKETDQTAVTEDDMYKDAVVAVVRSGTASTSLLSKRLSIGYGRAARLLETMEERGVISSTNGSSPRKVLISGIEQ